MSALGRALPPGVDGVAWYSTGEVIIVAHGNVRWAQIDEQGPSMAASRRRSRRRSEMDWLTLPWLVFLSAFFICSSGRFLFLFNFFSSNFLWPDVGL